MALTPLRSSVELDQELIDGGLIQNVQADNCLGDLAVDVLNCLEDALAAVTTLVTVAKLAGFVHTGGCAGGNGRAANGAVVEGNFDFNGGVAAGVKDLTRHDINNFKILLHVPVIPPVIWWIDYNPNRYKKKDKSINIIEFVKNDESLGKTVKTRLLSCAGRLRTGKKCGMMRENDSKTYGKADSAAPYRC